MKFKMLVISFLAITSFSCENCNVYYVNSSETVFNTTTTVEYAGEYYLNFSFTINRNDSLFVKDFKVIPINETENFPKFDKYKMTSFLSEKDELKSPPRYNITYVKVSPKNELRIDDFYSNDFSLLPKYNRLTNIGSYHITYSTFFKSEDPIEIKSFEVLVIVELIDRFNRLTIEKETLKFSRVENCWNSFAFH